VDLLTEIEIGVKSGEFYTQRVALPKGEPENPMSLEELANKFRRCAQGSLGEREVEQLLDMIAGMDGIEDLSGFFSILRRRS